MNNDNNPDSLVLQALHLIRAEAQKTNQELARTNEKLDRLDKSVNDRFDQVNARLDGTNERIDLLRTHTAQQITDLNHKVDARFDNILTGEVARRIQRFDALEDEVRRIAAKVDH